MNSPLYFGYSIIFQFRSRRLENSLFKSQRKIFHKSIRVLRITPIKIEKMVRHFSKIQSWKWSYFVSANQTGNKFIAENQPKIQKLLLITYPSQKNYDYASMWGTLNVTTKMTEVLKASEMFKWKCPSKIQLKVKVLMSISWVFCHFLQKIKTLPSLMVSEKIIGILSSNILWSTISFT